MTRMKGTVRIPKQDYKGRLGNAYEAKVEGQRLFFPYACSTVDTTAANVVDITCDLWFIKRYDLETVAEWEE